MSTRSAIAIRDEKGTPKGRYIHMDGYCVDDDVRKIIERDGRDKAVQTLIVENYGWSHLDPTITEEHSLAGRGMDDGRFKVVPGYGIAYTEEQGQSSPDEWIMGLDVFIEYFHVIEEDGSITTTTTHDEEDE